MKPDDYYGSVAENYDASREVKAKWRAEIAAVGEFLDTGPVLDVPLGTGRFVPIYQERGLSFTGVDISDDMLAIARRKFPGIDARNGSAFDMLSLEGKFATVVCIRFMEWLPLEKSAALINQLSRIAPALIVSINHGVEGKPEAHTYDFGKFLSVLDGLFIEARRVTATIPSITSEVFKLRPARWLDALAQFSHDDEPPWVAIQRIADKHAGFVGLPPIEVSEKTTTVRAEYWSGDRLGSIVTSLAEHRFVTDKPPRQTDGPLTILKRDGFELILDGRHRANVLMKSKGPHPVLVLEC